MTIRADWDDPMPLLPAIDVSDHKPVATGLVDRRGKPIMRVPNRVGFHTPKGAPRG